MYDSRKLDGEDIDWHELFLSYVYG